MASSKRKWHQYAHHRGGMASNGGPRLKRNVSGMYGMYA